MLFGSIGEMEFLHFIVVVFLVATLMGINGESTAKIPETIVRKDIKGRLLTVSEGCGYSKVSNTRIVGGTEAKIGAWPWIALIGRSAEYGIDFECGGSLITSRHVLSAAHCTNDAKIDLVRLGEHELNANHDGFHQDVPVAFIRQHRWFDNFLLINDIAMVYLERDVEFTDRISPICLPVSEEFRGRSFVGTTPFLAGWGAISENGPDARILQQVQLPVIENSQCKKDYQRIGEFFDQSQFDGRVICAGLRDGGKDNCDGDSGGPLMLPIHENGRFPFYQIGVISYGPTPCARPNVAGVYANVQYYSSWINESLELV